MFQKAAKVSLEIQIQRWF